MKIKKEDIQIDKQGIEKRKKNKEKKIYIKDSKK